jgi:hypothetical protein
MYTVSMNVSGECGRECNFCENFNPKSDIKFKSWQLLIPLAFERLSNDGHVE